MKRIIQTDHAPQAVGPYSQAVEVNGTLYISGQVPIDPRSGKLVPPDITGQTEQVMRNTGALLEAAGYGFGDVVKSTCLLTDISHFSEMNQVYSRFYPKDPPARAAYAVKELPLGALVEIETIAVRQ